MARKFTPFLVLITLSVLILLVAPVGARGDDGCGDSDSSVLPEPAPGGHAHLNPDRPMAPYRIIGSGPRAGPGAGSGSGSGSGAGSGPGPGGSLPLPTPNAAPRYVYYHLDHLGSPRVIADAGGQAISTHRYLPFGEEAPVAAMNSTTTRQFTGQERDSDTGLDYMVQRCSSSGLDRFLSIDPDRLSVTTMWPQSWNRYSYVLNNPLRFNDPDGDHVNPVTGEEGVKSGSQPGDIRQNTGHGGGEYGDPRAGGDTHKAIDVLGANGTDVKAAEGGTVVAAGPLDAKSGNAVIIDHGNGVVTSYSHLSEVDVKPGDVVTEGQVIGKAGQTGNAAGQPARDAHVHFRVKVNGQDYDPKLFLNDPAWHWRLRRLLDPGPWYTDEDAWPVDSCEPRDSC